MHQVKTQISVEAAHRLYDVNTFSRECRENLHGHSYKVEIVVERPELNSAGMVVDFKELKGLVKRNIENTYDHSCILKSNDPLCDAILQNCEKVIVVTENPTAEWMADRFYTLLNTDIRSIDDKLRISSVSVQETEHNIAIYRR